MLKAAHERNIGLATTPSDAAATIVAFVKPVSRAAFSRIFPGKAMSSVYDSVMETIG
jgi:hypothetical protein